MGKPRIDIIKKKRKKKVLRLFKVQLKHTTGGVSSLLLPPQKQGWEIGKREKDDSQRWAERYAVHLGWQRLIGFASLSSSSTFFIHLRDSQFVFLITTSSISKP
jgi:hypothetical protein